MAESRASDMIRDDFNTEAIAKNLNGEKRVNDI
jgi:hypothetical protein